MSMGQACSPGLHWRAQVAEQAVLYLTDFECAVVAAGTAAAAAAAASTAHPGGEGRHGAVWVG